MNIEVIKANNCIAEKETLFQITFYFLLYFKMYLLICHVRSSSLDQSNDSDAKYDSIEGDEGE